MSIYKILAPCVWLILSLTLGRFGSANGKECSALSIGLTPTFNDVISKGKISTDWVYEPEIEANSKRQRKVEQKESEYMYITYDGPGKIEEKDLSVTDKAKDLYMTLFKVNKVRDNYFTVSLLYFCSPLTHSVNQIIMEISPPDCPQVEITWFKVCGDMLSPHPGLQADLVLKDGRTFEFLRDGLPMYPNLNSNSIYTEVKDKDSSGPSVDEMIPEFTIDSDTAVVKFYTRLDDINLKYLASIADKNNTFEDLKKKALLYEMEPPVARHDKTLLKVELAGDLNFGGLVKENGMQTLTLDVKCLALEDAFVELQLFIHKQAPTSIMIKRMCSLGTKNQDGLLGAVVKSVLRLLFAIVKFCVMLLILAGIAVLFDRFVISNFVDPYLSRFKNRSKHDKSSKSNEPLGDIIELRTLTGKKQYGTLN